MDEKRYLVSHHDRVGELSLIGAQGILEVFPDEGGAFALARAVIEALDDAGIMFAQLSTMKESDEEEETLDE